MNTLAKQAQPQCRQSHAMKGTFDRLPHLRHWSLAVCSKDVRGGLEHARSLKNAEAPLWTWTASRRPAEEVYAANATLTATRDPEPVRGLPHGIAVRRT
jgi:hypothetical protein